MKLKSGGPLMTVTFTDERKTGTAGESGLLVRTSWFVGMHGPYEHEFDSSCLRHSAKGTSQAASNQT